MFDPKKYLIKVQGGRQYLPVSARLIWFREDHSDWGIETRPITIDTDKQFAIFEASVFNSDGKLMSKGTKMETVRGFPDYIEKAETGAVGRALAVCGYGTQFSPELDEVTSDRVVDTPQYSRSSNGNGLSSGHSSHGVANSDEENCRDCGVGLKASQVTLSVRKFGSALCPDCQKKHRDADNLVAAG